MRPTFAGFYVAKGGLDAARANLSITGQNMTNANTQGYTRQRVDLYTVGPTGWKTRYANSVSSYIGEGVAIGGINQLRDPYLDVRYRSENAKVGNTSTQLDTLSELEGLLDESVKDGLSTQISDLIKQLQNLTLNPGDPVSESIVKTSAQMLTKIFNDASSKIHSMREKQVDQLDSGAINTVNNLMNNIAHVNEEIKQAQIMGNPALELLDSRNQMIDELSGFVPIQTSSKLVHIGGDLSVEELSINMIGSDGEKFTLIDHDKAHSFETVKDIDGAVEVPVRIKLLDSDGVPVNSGDKGIISLNGGDITDQILSGEFYGHLKMINAEGSFGDPPTKERGIQFYSNMLDTLANKIGTEFNAANSTDGKVDAAGNPIYDKPLFGTSDGSGKITAKNFAISDKWNNTTGSYITNSKVVTDEGIVAPNASDNILHMISLFSKTFAFETPGRPAGTNFPTDPGLPTQPLFQGTFQAFFDNTVVTIGNEIKDVNRQFESFGGVLSDIDYQRASVSSVNMDEEGINLIQYNQSLTASSRFMTTLDEALDTIINKMGVVGR